MLGDSASSGPPAFAPDAATLTTSPLDSAPLHHHVTPSLHWHRTGTGLTIRAPRTRHVLPALAGVLLTCVALGVAVLRLANLPIARDAADRLGSVILLILPCLFGVMGLFALLPLVCPPRLRLDADGATLSLPVGFRLYRRHLPPGTFEIRTHLWARTQGAAKLGTLFLRDRRNHATYPVFHKYPASELAEIVQSIAANLTPATRAS